MTEPGEQPRLATIFAADMVGDSRPMEAHEPAPMTRQRVQRAEPIDRTIAEHHGRIVEATDDRLLVVFARAVDAVRCAMEVQRTLAKRRETASETDQMQFRIGVHTGGVSGETGALHGDGIDGATRLASLSEPGGFCISGVVHDEVRFQLKLPYDVRRDPKSSAYQCGGIRKNLHVMNLIDLSAVRISAAAINNPSKINNTRDLIVAKAIAARRQIVRLLYRNTFASVADGRKR